MSRVVIADDHSLVRAGIRALLERAADLQVVGEAQDGQQAIQLVEQLEPDVLLMDLSMPRLNGLEALDRLKAMGSKTRVIIVSVHADRALVVQTLKAGARGYLLKDSFKEELYLAVRAAARGELYISPQLADAVFDNLLKSTGERATGNPLEELSSREREVLQLILEDKTNRQIAALLGISVKTVDKHRTSLMKKLNVHNAVELVKVAMKNHPLYAR